MGTQSAALSPFAGAPHRTSCPLNRPPAATGVAKAVLLLAQIVDKVTVKPAKSRERKRRQVAALPWRGDGAGLQIDLLIALPITFRLRWAASRFARRQWQRVDHQAPKA